MTIGSHPTTRVYYLSLHTAAKHDIELVGPYRDQSEAERAMTAILATGKICRLFVGWQDEVTGKV